MEVNHYNIREHTLLITEKCPLACKYCYLEKDKLSSQSLRTDFTYEEIEQKVSKYVGQDLKEGFVPDTYYLLMADNYPVGIAKLRHYLNEALSKRGGHIGYCIRPSSRGQKFGNIILQKVLEQAKLKNIDRVLLTIREDNIPSRKACEHNGGKLEKIQYIENNNVCFYWIDLSQNKK